MDIKICERERDVEEVGFLWISQTLGLLICFNNVSNDERLLIDEEYCNCTGFVPPFDLLN